VSEPAAFTLKELEGLYGPSERTLRREIKDGRLRAAKVAGAWRVLREDWQAWWEAQVFDPATGAPAPARRRRRTGPRQPTAGSVRALMAIEGES
jgi:excisionase family DNA binding protein